ncbi:hypothetical protein I6F14_26130 [Bradyrhizobium sp. IC3069]|uniref:hypothetical protein n=1 Tax=unclassified Bradyrhizobium TaxID=2631580 RepID=UPI001CD50BB6|nr:MULTISPECIES: hypothetical protein [unclassified Bradyrhizobium]MCA1364422.1 hypothetical protein [Bradyrhizobium sp. IC4059]MCA1376348.1 hypothetical protein [Bradyrhizobium sp. IC4060]MCA1487115.1 hypothetical protein [Bradyrhizobium sp. IC4061]MCA1521408.1 hypothetical protein [Bradyrhizobium sp. IC3069]MCA1542909.1 hypothetical protein [Bradyrhizobium sp. NBAIM32]
MDRAMALRHLAEAEEHISLADRHLSEQEVRIADLELSGHDTSLARAIGETFRLTLARHLAHRDHILRELTP